MRLLVFDDERLAVATVKVTREECCSDRCFDAAEADELSYAPCPLFNWRNYDPAELCRMCGWVIPKEKES
jgi:hypothetical protein